jgi:hypothetical protein
MSELQDLTALIRANTPLIVIQTQDESRVVELFRQALMHVWRALYRWSITEGLRRIDMDREDEAFGPPDASSVLRMIQEAEQRGIYLLLDFHPYLGYASHQCWCWSGPRSSCRRSWRPWPPASTRACPTPTRC